MNVIRNKAAEYIKIKPDANEDTDNIKSVNEDFPSTIKCETGKINPFCLAPPTHTGQLKPHMTKHTGEKPFSCEICDYKCYKKHDLRIHIRKHTDEKTFSCDFCVNKFYSRGNLKKHILTHTKEKPFSCNLCDFQCARQDNLNRHMLTHTGEKPFSCSICDYKCARKDCMKTHMLTHHKTHNKQETIII